MTGTQECVDWLASTRLKEIIYHRPNYCTDFGLICSIVQALWYIWIFLRSFIWTVKPCHRWRNTFDISQIVQMGRIFDYDPIYGQPMGIKGDLKL